MGMTLTRLIASASDLALAGAAAEPGHVLIGEDAGLAAGVGRLGIAICDSPAKAVADCDVAIDFTAAAATGANLTACMKHRRPLVLGTTGLAEQHMRQLENAAQEIPVVYGRNMSVGILVLTELARIAARLLGPEADIEIRDTHHRGKVDAPSGTALQLGEAIAAERGARLDDVATIDRAARSALRQPGSIGFSSVRAGSIVGDHDVLFALDEDVVHLKHRALDRAIFARGALRAARWVVGRQPALYSMANVLGLEHGRG
jgi:4-hydroxy-tetrahydrodipicolinate reductase